MGFRLGVASVFGGLAFIVRTPRAWPLAAVPVVLFLALSGAAIHAALTWVTPAVKQWAGGFGNLAASAAAYGATAAAIVAGVPLALVLATPLSGPALDPLVTLAEREAGVNERPSVGVIRELGSALKAQVLVVAVTVPCLAGLFAVSIVFPPASVVTMPTKFLLVAATVAWNLLDYPLALRGWGVRKRLDAFRRHATAVIGFGTGFAMLFAIPCAGLLLLPAGVVGATRLLHALGELER